MNIIKSVCFGLLLEILFNPMAWAHGHGHGHGGGWGGYGGGWGGYGYPTLGFGFGSSYYPSYRYYPPVISAPSPPIIYIERNSTQFYQPQQANYWYYCTNPQGYYPDIKSCSVGWIQVPPRPH